MLILNMAMNIHSTVRFLQLKKDLTSISKDDVIVETSKRMFLPIYTVLTTICAFIFNLVALNQLLILDG